MGAFKEYGKYDGLGLAELVKKKKIKPTELIEEAISRIERLNPKLNAVIHKMYDKALAAAKNKLPDGPFTGVPFLLKDLLVKYAGEPTTNGCKALAKNVPNFDSEIVKRFKNSGVIILGKTNTPEFGLSVVTESELFGACNNPWDLSRTTGGSSGGAAAAVAARIVPIAHGNDGGGSIRIPSSCCGLFGLKPTRGRDPMGPDVGDIWHGFASNHVLTRSVRDSAAMLDATCGPDPGPPYCTSSPVRPFLKETEKTPGKLKIAFSSNAAMSAEVHPDCLKSLQKTVELCKSLGHEVIEDDPDINKEEFARAFTTMICCETRTDILEIQYKLGRKVKLKDFEPATWAIALLGKHIKADSFIKAHRLINCIARKMGSFFNTYDILLTPTLAQPPVKKGALNSKGMELFFLKLLGGLNSGKILSKIAGVNVMAERVFGFAPYTALLNATGQPAMSVPLYWNKENLPIGMQFIGKYGDEAGLLRLAGQLEKAKPWFNKMPPVSIP